MRRAIIWVLIILLVAGFIYTGNNLLKADGFTESKMFPLKYVPKVDMLVMENGDNNVVSILFPTLSSPFSIKNSSNIIHLVDDSSISYISRSENTDMDLKDYLLYSFRQNSFYDTRLEWENGFPLITASNLNKRFFASVWRNNEIISSDKSALEKIFSTILQKNTSIEKNSDFQNLWKNSKFPVYGIVYKNAKDIFNQNLQIPSFTLTYPVFFEAKSDKIMLTNTDNSPRGTLFFKPFDFDKAVFEIAKPEAEKIKNLIEESGLQMIISEKLNIPFAKFSAFSSMNSGEFALLGKSNFVFLVKSTPISNSLYETELQNLLPDAKVSKQKAGSFILLTYQNASTQFYTLEMPTFFAISTDKESLLKMANKEVKRIDAGNCAEFLSVKSAFNDVIKLYSLNIAPLRLPAQATSCTVTQKKQNGKLITEIDMK